MTGRRITVILPPSSAKALEYLTEATEDNMTDVVARALRLYEFIEKAAQSGGKVMVQHKEQSQPQTLHII